MPWCPKCKEEYREGFRRCASCGSTLVERVPKEPEEEEMDAGEPVLLACSNNNLTLRMMDGALRDANIPFYYREKGLGSSYSPYMNATTGGVEIYVPKKLLDRARDITSIFTSDQLGCGNQCNQGQPDIDGSEKARRERKRNVIAACIFIFIIVPGGIVLYLWASGLM